MSFDSLSHAQIKLFVAKCNSLNVYVKSEFSSLLASLMMRIGELVEAVPGMVATQHSGTGKANQYFLRGLNLDHGTDFSTFVDGVPINMRTHGHGQGYLDLNFSYTTKLMRES